MKCLPVIIHIIGRRQWCYKSANHTDTAHSIIYSRAQGLSPDWVIVLSSCPRIVTLTVPLSTQEYKWVLVNCEGNLTKCWGGGNLQWTSIPSRGVVILQVTSCYRNQDKLWQCMWATRVMCRLYLTFFHNRKYPWHQLCKCILPQKCKNTYRDKTATLTLLVLSVFLAFSFNSLVYENNKIQMVHYFTNSCTGEK